LWLFKVFDAMVDVVTNFYLMQNEVLHKYKEEHKVSVIQQSQLDFLLEYKKKYLQDAGLPLTFLDDHLLEQVLI